LRLALALLLALALPASAQQLKPWTGGKAPALELTDAQGRPHRLADYRGKAVLVNFWATWCEPCREEMPSMERLRAAMQDKPFVVLAVNVGEGERAARAFGEKMQLGFPLLLDRDTKTARAWSARVLPASFVLGPDGSIRYSYFGAIDWARDDVRQAIEGLLR
jgi:peroxiredoxin